MFRGQHVPYIPLLYPQRLKGVNSPIYPPVVLRSTDLEEANVQHDGLVVVDGLMPKRVREVPKTRRQLNELLFGRFSRPQRTEGTQKGGDKA